MRAEMVKMKTSPTRPGARLLRNVSGRDEERWMLAPRFMAAIWRDGKSLRCLDHFGCWGTDAAPPPRTRGDRKDFHRADRSGAATNVASTSNRPVMRLER
jgi:hypothetical protein